MSAVGLGGDPQVLLTHMAFYGAAAILAETGVEGLTLCWRDDVACLEGPDLDETVLDAAVRAHAAVHVGPSSWVRQERTIDGARRGLMSPRLTVFKTDATWAFVQAERHTVLQELTDRRAWLDLRLLAALGEPCYWSRNTKGEWLQDDGASRLEMQPRNRGSEVITNRLRPLAEIVARRAPGAAAAGLVGRAPVDELGRGAADSSTPTGFATPGPTDNAVAWCALWGISAFLLARRVNATATTSGHLGRSRVEWFQVPIWSKPWRLARLRTVIASDQLRTAAGAGLGGSSEGAAREVAAGAWLRARTVRGVVRFPIDRFGSDNAPERRALPGEPVELRGTR